MIFIFWAYRIAQFSVQWCTIFCAKESVHVVLLEALQIFGKASMYSKEWISVFYAVNLSIDVEI
jgi:hypothetical protein